MATQHRSGTAATTPADKAPIPFEDGDDRAFILAGEHIDHLYKATAWAIAIRTIARDLLNEVIDNDLFYRIDAVERLADEVHQALDEATKEAEPRAATLDPA